MIPPEVLNSKSLFSLLHKIDQDLTERTRAKRCPFAGVHCTMPITNESLWVGPRILKRRLRFDLACAAAVRVAVAVCCRLRFVFGVAGFTGRLCCCWSGPFARDKNLWSRWGILRRFEAYGVQPSSAGNTTFENFLLRVSATGDCPDTCCPRSIRISFPEHYCHAFTQSMVDTRSLW